jgi:succinate-semialdehyde dehydrogenase / glutarate-semialdehyde dehydrogenase
VYFRSHLFRAREHFIANHTPDLKEGSMSVSQIVSINPATEEINATFEPTPARNVDRALGCAAAAAQTWRALPLSERAKSLFAMADALRANRERLAGHITQEMGKPLLESLAEVDKSAWCCEFYAEHGPAMLADQPVSTSAKRSYVSYEPLGLVLAVMPWNFPLWQVFRFAPPTLLAGNGIVLKHAPNVPQCALDIAEIVDQVCPPGLFTTLLVGTGQVADLIADDRIHAVTLTASTEVGQLVAATAGRHLKRQVLELGGSDPFIALADADVAAAAAAAVSARNHNAGQSCIAAKRFIVEDAIRSEFTEAFVAGVAKLTVGDPMLESTLVGPLAKATIRQSLIGQVERSVSAGAGLITGGTPLEGRGYFFNPAVLDDVTPGMAVSAEETFGPVAAIMGVPDASSAVEAANATEFGLGASLWTSDLERAATLIPQLGAGAVFVNDIVTSDPRMPFGGIKRSGYGRELGTFGPREFTNVKTVWIGPSRDARTPHLSE